jgi:hypothetical protein
MVAARARQWEGQMIRFLSSLLIGSILALLLALTVRWWVGQ